MEMNPVLVRFLENRSAVVFFVDSDRITGQVVLSYDFIKGVMADQGKKVPEDTESYQEEAHSVLEHAGRILLDFTKGLAGGAAE